jgi:hypothetical protein
LNPKPTDAHSYQAAADELQRTIAELVAERRRSRRQRLWNLILLGIAISLPFHIAIIAYLASARMAGKPAEAQQEILIDFSVLTEAEFEEIGDPLEVESLDAPEVEEETVFSEMASDELETISAASVTNLDLSGAVPAPGGGAGLGNSDAVGGGMAGGASFFGVSSRGRRFAYIVDISGSMRSNDKFPVAMAELKRSIAALPDYASFVVLLYSNELRVPPFQTGWLRATPGTIVRVPRWIDTVSPGGGTLPYGAFIEVFKLEERPDAIFFLTDGIIPDNIPEKVGDLNSKGRSVVINTISFGMDAAVTPLKKIAAESDGTYRHVNSIGGPAP